MELLTISQVSKEYGISARMLRYYEQIGLITSMRKDDYAYRVYDEAAINRLRQIIILRKLRVPVKQIVSILNNFDAAETIEIFRQNIHQLDEEITALSTVKSILMRFVEELQEKSDISLNIGLLGDEAIFSIVNSLSFSNNHIKEAKENILMDKLNAASEGASKLADKDIRIVYLPPMTIAAAYASGDGCEGRAGDRIKQFVKESGLLEIKPDTRSFGFDCSQTDAGIGESSQMYEMWVSIPDEMEVSAPLVKRHFNGGVYAAHVLRSWDFDDWRLLKEWVDVSDKYDNDWGSPRWMSLETLSGQGFEETLNFRNYIQMGGDLQLDLLFPIRIKGSSSGRKDLSDVCNYMKAIVIPEVPSGFMVAETFRYGLSDAELELGITAFRTFLYTLYDKLSTDKDRIDVETGQNFDPDSVDGLLHVCCEGSVHKCFPVINDLAVILFNLGYRGKLEAEPENGLIISGNNLLIPFDPKNEKYNSFNNIVNKRKKEMFHILSELGFIFEGVDFSREIDFTKIETFHVKHKNNPHLPLGLKLLAEAQAIKKSGSGYYYLKAGFMRCDFYPLANKKAMVKDLNFNLFLNPHPPEVREWIIGMGKVLTDNGCKISGEINNFNSNIIFTYTSRRTGKDICKIAMGMEGCKAFLYGRHFADEDNILAYLPESMLDTVSDGKHECTGCATKRPDLVDHNIRYTIKGKKFRRCHGKGFGFPLDKAEERDIIEKWIMMELAWS